VRRVTNGGYPPPGAPPPGYGPPPGGPPPNVYQPPPPAWTQHPQNASTPSWARGPGWFENVRLNGYVPTDYEKDQAFYAHLFAALGAFFTCGLIPPFAWPMLVYAMAKEKPPFLVYHVNQAALFQVALYAVNLGLSVVGSILAIVCIGYLILMLIPIVALLASIYPLILAFGAKNGEWNEYPIIGPKIRAEWKPVLS
jgi:uncharacterized membrane protein